MGTHEKCAVISTVSIVKVEEEPILRRRRKYQRKGGAAKDKHSLIVNPKFRARQKIQSLSVEGRKKKRLVKFAR